MKDGAPTHETLHIIVHRRGGGHKHGTFTGPPPKMRVDVNDYMRWDVQVVPPDATATFTITFPGFSWPFAGAPTPISDGAERQAVNAGLYHYAVQVTTVDGVFFIQDCPEADVGG